VSIAFDGSNMTVQQKGNLTMIQYTPLPGDITGPNGVPNGKVDIRDVSYVAKRFGTSTTWINITSYVDTTNNIIYGTTTHFSFIAIHG